jgi:hypothetical protein
MARGHGAQFLTAERVPHEYGRFEFQRVEHGQHVVAKPIRLVPGGGLTGRAESTPRNTVHVVTDRESRREIIEYVSIVSHARYKYERPARASPVEYFQSHISIDGDELNLVWGRVTPRSGALRAN